MKRRIIVILISSIIAVVVFNFFQARINSVEIGSNTVNLPKYSDPAKPIKIKEGKEFIIALDSNRTTGYAWQLAGAIDKTMLKVVEIKRSRGQKKLFGAGGKDLWTLRALKEGESSIAFEYVRSWEKHVSPVKKYHFTVIIEK